MVASNNRASGTSTASIILSGCIGLAVFLLVTTAGVAALTTPSTTTKINKSDDDNIPNFIIDSRDKHLHLFHVESTTSTQEEAKRLVREPIKTTKNETPEDVSETATATTTSTSDLPNLDLSNDKDNTLCFAVTATEQSNGRGTSGRIWMSARGNTFVTIGIQQSGWMVKTGIPLTLLPLKVGTIVATRVSELLQMDNNASTASTTTSNIPFVTVKWPNDVLVDDQKIAGILIESERDTKGNYWMLIGIGINVAYTPTVPTSGPNHGRRATSIRQIIEKYNNNNNNNNNATTNDDEDNSPNTKKEEQEGDDEGNNEKYVSIARQIGIDIAYDLSNWLQKSALLKSKNSGPSTTSMIQDEVLKEWRTWVDWDMKLVLRDSDDKVPVRAVEVHTDGRLKVQDQYGRERLLVSDYFI